MGAVGRQGELRYHQRLSPYVQKGTVHLILLVGKDPQLDDFLGQDIGLGLRIALHHAQQHRKAGSDLPHDASIHGHAGFAHPLNYCFHLIFLPLGLIILNSVWEFNLLGGAI